MHQVSRHRETDKYPGKWLKVPPKEGRKVAGSRCLQARTRNFSVQSVRSPTVSRLVLVGEAREVIMIGESQYQGSGNPSQSQLEGVTLKPQKLSENPFKSATTSKEELQSRKLPGEVSIGNHKVQPTKLPQSRNRSSQLQNQILPSEKVPTRQLSQLQIAGCRLVDLICCSSRRRTRG